jgi:hypothetical protein
VQSYGHNEATVYRTIQKVENALICLGKLRLQSKKVLQLSATLFNVVLVDVSEQPIKRPRKQKVTLQRQKEATHVKSTVDC